MTTVEEIVNAHIKDGKVHRAAMIRALQEREDNLADLIRLAGTQFGLYPEIVAKVVTDIGLGTPPTDEARAYINQQFVACMERLRDQNNQ